MGLRLRQQLVESREHVLGGVAHQPSRRRQPLGPLGGAAQDEHGNAQGGRFLLDAARVGQDHGGARHQPHERDVRQRVDQADVGQRSQHSPRGLAHPRVVVHRVHEVELGMPGGRLGDALEERLDRRPAAPDGIPALAAMESQQHHPPTTLRLVHLPGLLERQQQAVHHGVAGDVDLLARHALVHQVLGGVRRGSEVQVAHARQHATVRLLRVGVEAVEAAQTRLDVRHRDPAVEGRERRPEGAGGVALHHDQVRSLLREALLQAGEQALQDAVERLPARHDAQVEVGLDPEGPQDLVHHLPVLAGHDHARREARVGSQQPHELEQLDALGPRAEHERDPVGRPDAGRWEAGHRVHARLRSGADSRAIWRLSRGCRLTESDRPRTGLH